jgi:hypothetical protein
VAQAAPQATDNAGDQNVSYAQPAGSSSSVPQSGGNFQRGGRGNSRFTWTRGGHRGRGYHPYFNPYDPYMMGMMAAQMPQYGYYPVPHAPVMSAAPEQLALPPPESSASNSSPNPPTSSA